MLINCILFNSWQSILSASGWLIWVIPPKVGCSYRRIWETLFFIVYISTCHTRVGTPGIARSITCLHVGAAIDIRGSAGLHLAARSIIRQAKKLMQQTSLYLRCNIECKIYFVRMWSESIVLFIFLTLKSFMIFFQLLVIIIISG